ncbi:hypothetical protein [Streptomyces sp. MUM 2J]|uniref:hypothetical protein n=1 Tax=Streptomyces sp. MUM 2J TaxID=2791987 RepID=UPI001F048CD5|nr:hypothetical protein [Streptomyces sp. MUM 2J]MCH0562651.1 hypothetical protein [Streptomyces sp. MUM 2J]
MTAKDNRPDRSGPAGAKGPDELRRQMAEARGESGSTGVEPSGGTGAQERARARAADLRDKAGAMSVQLRSSAAQAGHAVQDRAARAGQAVQDRAAQAGHAAEQSAPRPVRPVVRSGMRHPGLVLAAGAAAGAVVAVEVRRWRHRAR